MKISFCITSMNRNHHIFTTLPKNLKDNINNKNKYEFVLIDFNNNHILKNFILSNFKNQLDNKILNYFHTDELIKFHAPIAKNTAHKLADGDILVNLDSDNFTGINAADFIADIFKNNKNIILHQSNFKFQSGTMGRISIHKDNFYKLGGYNEQLFEMSVQDSDIIHRAKFLGLEYININKNNDTIKNDKNNKKYYQDMMKVNNIISKFNLKLCRIKANNFTKSLNIGIMKNIFQYNSDGTYLKIL